MKRSKYKGVYCWVNESEKTTRNALKIDNPWHSKHMYKGVKWKSKDFKTEREAALAYDKRMIELGLEPVNILKRK